VPPSGRPSGAQPAAMPRCRPEGSRTRPIGLDFLVHCDAPSGTPRCAGGETVGRSGTALGSLPGSDPPAGWLFRPRRFGRARRPHRAPRRPHRPRPPAVTRWPPSARPGASLLPKVSPTACGLPRGHDAGTLGFDAQARGCIAVWSLGGGERTPRTGRAHQVPLCPQRAREYVQCRATFALTF